MKDIDDTDPTESESECPCCSCKYDWEALFTAWNRDRDDIRALQAQVADLHHRRRVSRQQATDQDPEWFS